MIGAAAVEAVGYVALGRCVALDVGVEQQQRDAADLAQPDLRLQVTPGQSHRNHDRRTVGLGQQRQRQAVRVDRRVALLLPAFARQRLVEVAAAIQQPHTDHRDAEIAGGLEVVTGQNPEPAGVLRQHGGDAVLGGEVGDRLRGVVTQRLEPAVLGQVLVQVLGGLVEAPEEVLVGRQLGEPRVRHEPEHPPGVTADRPPCGRVDRLEKIERLRVP